MPDVVINILAQVADAVSGLAQVAGASTSLTHANQDAAGALSTFGLDLNALSNPLTLVAGGLKDSMDKASAWGQTVEKLANESGQTAQQASTLAVVFGDFGVSTDSLDRVVKKFTQEGLTFNLDTIKSLSAQYNALTDPVARNEFAYKNFGMAAQNLNEILAAGPEQLQSMADKAQYTGQVLDESAVKSLEAARIKTKQFGDELDGLKIKLGAAAIDEVSKAGDALKSWWGILNSVTIATEAYTGKITWQQATAREAAAANGDMFAAFQTAIPTLATVSDASDRAAAAQAAMATSSATATTKAQELKAAQDGVATSTAGLGPINAQMASAVEAATARANIAYEGTAQSLSKLTVANLGAAAIKALQDQMSADPGNADKYQKAIDQVGLKSGLLTPAGIAAAGALTELTTAFHQNRIGPDDFSTALDKVPAAIRKNGGAIPSLSDLGLDLDRAKTHFEDARHGPENFGTSLMDMVNTHVSLTNLALDSESGMTGVTKHVQSSLDQLVNLGIIPFGSQMDALITGHVSPANRAMDELKTSIDKVQSKTVVITVITKHVDQYANAP